MKVQLIFYFNLFWLFVFVFPLESWGQLTVVQGSTISLTPQQFVETYLVGAGITISNAKYNGSTEPLNSTNRLPLKARDQIGSFANTGGAASQLGIDGGVILSTGFVGKAKAGSNPSDDMWGNSQPAESDPDLVILAGNTIHDKSVLEFDFVPQTDVVTFRYVFGSIEFDSFCSSINDAFGLFLSGPGIAGGLGFVNDAVNIALLPNSTNYVTIFNICAADQGNLGNGVYSWWNVKKDYFSYNRLTYVFTASYTVACNQTYHMKFAIGDASDGVLDSGVFLEQNSFTSNNVTSSVSFSNPLTGQLLVEGCSDVSLVYSIPQPHTTDLTVDVAIQSAGTATQADILPNPFPSHVTIPAGQLQSTPILIIPISDGLPEPVENLIIEGSTITCGITTVVTSEFSIKDFSPLSVNINNVIICIGSSTTLTPTITGGQPVLPANAYTYVWSNTATTASITVTPPAGIHLYSVTVTDACNQSAAKEITVEVRTVPGPAGIITGLNSTCVPVTGITYSIVPITGAESYSWTLPAGATITAGANTNSITVDFSSATASGTISVQGHNVICGFGTPSTLAVTINPLPGDAGTIVSTTGYEVCQNQTGFSYSVNAIPNASTYIWSYTGTGISMTNNGTDLIIDFSVTATSGILTVKAQNACGDGMPSPPFPINVKPIPTVGFTVCNSIATTKNSRPIMLKGGSPIGANGEYFGTGVIMAAPGSYVFDPGNSSVIGGTPSVGVVHQVTYRYTNSQGCYDDKTITISVYASNANDPCPGTVKDHRDGKIYPTFLEGSGVNARCWMSANLNYGTFTDHKIVQTDNCTLEKYCKENIAAQCGSSGGYYQWGEIMGYQENYMFQDICPGGWHVPTATEWQNLIDKLPNTTPGDGLAGSYLAFQTGFNAMFNGIYYQNNTWSFTTGSPSVTMFWTSTLAGTNPVARGVNTINTSVSKYNSSKASAFPVRCIKN
ncbi:MAG: choice-of-anchor L domain-containing protein [Bacteroidales bacterium]|nr:choice-of-anchor L domain-containing protein [Bacteroidales bacterium]